jgi:glyoxylase-like metal-dependent hydrolase (beta-lactamase superfamily II)
VTEIAPNVHSIGHVGGSWLKGGWARGFLLDLPGELTLIDTLFERNARLVREQLDRLGRSPRDLKRIVLTHAHRAHLGGLAVMRELSSAPVYAHPREVDIVEGSRKARRVPLLPQRPFHFRTYFPWQLGLALGRGKHDACGVSGTLKHGDSLGPLEVIEAPGHTPGHVAFYYEDAGILFAGDAIATWPELSPGWPAFNLDRAQAYRSLLGFRAWTPRIVAVGHGDPIRTGATEAVHRLAEEEAGRLDRRAWARGAARSER